MTAQSSKSLDRSGANSEPAGKDAKRTRSDGLLTTGDMARLTGNTLRTVRFYEEAGVLCPDRRSAGGHRLFSRRELDRLQFISDMRAADLSLDEIRQLLELKTKADNGAEAASEAIEALESQLTSLDEKIAIFTRLRDELRTAHELLLECRKCTSDEGFPESCNDCGVLASQGEVPHSMKVLWAVDDS